MKRHSSTIRFAALSLCLVATAIGVRIAAFEVGEKAPRLQDFTRATYSNLPAVTLATKKETPSAPVVAIQKTKEPDPLVIDDATKPLNYESHDSKAINTAPNIAVAIEAQSLPKEAETVDSKGNDQHVPVTASPETNTAAVSRATDVEQDAVDHPLARLVSFEPTRQPEVDVDRFAALPPLQDEPRPRFRKFAAPDPENSNDKNNQTETETPPPPKQPVVLSAANRWKLAGSPEFGQRYKDDTPLLDSNSTFIDGVQGNFSQTPTMPHLAYDPAAEMNVYQGKTLNANQRPLLELGRPWYQLGPITEGSSFLGFHNNINVQYVLFGDYRTGIASNRQNGNTDSLIASQLNLFHHLKFTSTERIVAGMTPLGAAQNTRYDFERDEFIFEGDADFDFAFIEADIGAITGGFIGETLPFDLPVAIGIMPLVFQNGVWFEDAILGAAVTIPARNSPRFDISNMDITFFAGYDKIDSPAFQGDDSAARIIGVATFIEALNGYFEIDYAFLDDRTNLDRSYHNFGAAYTRRFGRFLSHSSRIIVNAGQESNVQDNTADGVLLISENSLITGFPSTVVPYLNMWAGFDRPQSAARAGAAGGVLRNTGILFESDNLTGYPTLDATANETFGLAMGLNLLADEFAQQLIVEMAMLGVMGEDANRNAAGDQYGVGARYQLPLTNSVIFRADAMVGFLRGDNDINGVRMELRKKW